MRLHEMGNLLQAISALADDSSQDPAVWKERLSKIRSLASMASDLDAFSRPLESAALADILHTQSALMEAMYPGVDVKVEVRPIALAAAVSPRSIGRAVLNLCLNSAEAMSGKGRIELGAQIADGKAEIRVVDNGPGIPPERLKRVTEHGFSTTQGSGLGLGIVRSIVRSAGGTFEIRSGTRGTLVSIRLNQASALTTAPPPSPESKGKRLLVVEDDGSIRKTVERCLAEHGYEVRSTNDPVEALRILGREPVDLLLTDVVMEEMTGSMLAEKSLEIRPDLAIILMSGFSPGETGSNFPFIQKPFAEATLLEAVALSLKQAAGTAV